MNVNMEKKFVKEYIKKNKRDRIYYELSSAKKRKSAIGRFCHNAMDFIDERKVEYYGTDLSRVKEIIDKAYKKECYMISWDASVDGCMYKPFEAINIMNNMGMPSIVVFEDFCIIRTEQTSGTPEIIIMSYRKFNEKAK